jgi:hypothetical protein
MTRRKLLFCCERFLNNLHFLSVKLRQSLLLCLSLRNFWDIGCVLWRVLWRSCYCFPLCLIIFFLCFELFFHGIYFRLLLYLPFWRLILFFNYRLYNFCRFNQSSLLSYLQFLCHIRRLLFLSLYSFLWLFWILLFRL